MIGWSRGLQQVAHLFGLHSVNLQSTNDYNYVPSPRSSTQNLVGDSNGRGRCKERQKRGG